MKPKNDEENTRKHKGLRGIGKMSSHEVIVGSWKLRHGRAVAPCPRSHAPRRSAPLVEDTATGSDVGGSKKDTCMSYTCPYLFY